MPDILGYGFSCPVSNIAVDVTVDVTVKVPFLAGVVLPTTASKLDSSINDMFIVLVSPGDPITLKFNSTTEPLLPFCIAAS